MSAARSDRKSRRSQARSTGRTAETAATVADVCRALEAIAPLSLAQAWDNVGLLAGDRTVAARRGLLCIDLTGPVVAEAIRRRVQIVIAYHPPIFKPISRLTGPGAGMDGLVLRCISAGIAIYSPHTALDAAEGGTNDVIADLCGIGARRPIEYTESTAGECKVVVFVPAEAVERVAEAMFAAGAGRIGDYERCSFRLSGEGTFFGTDATQPVVGQKGRFERVAEIRLEVVTPTRRLPHVVEAIHAAHPYEEPAFDVYPLASKPTQGIGRVGRLPAPTGLGKLAAKLKRATRAAGAQIVGTARQRVERAVIVVGAAGSLPLSAGLATGDVVITGEVRHHDALTVLRHGSTAIALGHWSSERPVLAPLADRLACELPSIQWIVSTADHEPLQPVAG